MNFRIRERGAKLNILFLDIEASNLSASMGYVLAIGYKWAHEKKAKVLTLAQYPGKKKTDDTELLKAFEPIFLKADVVVHHFGQYYDIPFLQTRRIIHKMNPLPVVSQVDTWRIAKKRLKFHSNRLDAILKALGCPYQKTALDGNIWIDASAGDRKALKYVAEHCYWDVMVLEWVYNRLKSVWDQHPTVYSAANNPCKVCGKGKMLSNGLRPGSKKVYRRLSCSKCGFTDKGVIIK